MRGHAGRVAINSRWTAGIHRTQARVYRTRSTHAPLHARDGTQHKQKHLHTAHTHTGVPPPHNIVPLRLHTVPQSSRDPAPGSGFRVQGAAFRETRPSSATCSSPRRAGPQPGRGSRKGREQGHTQGGQGITSRDEVSGEAQGERGGSQPS